MHSEINYQIAKMLYTKKPEDTQSNVTAEASSIQVPGRKYVIHLNRDQRTDLEKEMKINFDNALLHSDKSSLQTNSMRSALSGTTKLGCGDSPDVSTKKSVKPISAKKRNVKLQTSEAYISKTLPDVLPPYIPSDERTAPKSHWRTKHQPSTMNLETSTCQSSTSDAQHSDFSFKSFRDGSCIQRTTSRREKSKGSVKKSSVATESRDGDQNSAAAPPQEETEPRLIFSAANLPNSTTSDAASSEGFSVEPPVRPPRKTPAIIGPFCDETLTSALDKCISIGYLMAGSTLTPLPMND